MKKETRSWPQTLANYYEHLTRDLTDDETHSVLSEERARYESVLSRAEEYLRGVQLFYEQSTLVDPDAPGESKKGSVSLSDGDSDTIVKRGSQNTTKAAEELSDKEI